MKLTEHFTLEELTRTSQKADNTPTETHKKHLKEMCENMLEDFRVFYGKPIRINSGYRSAKVNKLVGGSATSAHSLGYAVDTVPYDGDMRAYQHAVLEWAKTHKFDQIIIEYPKGSLASWIHIGYKNGSGQQRRQIIYTLNGKNYLPITDKYRV